jgi:hypothetical protein
MVQLWALTVAEKVQAQSPHTNKVLTKPGEYRLRPSRREILGATIFIA